MASPSKSIGDRGEEIAAQHLCEKGYEILNRNYRFRNGELDIVARKQSVLVFVEVKTIDLGLSSEMNFGAPETWLTLKKQKFMRQCVEHYLWKKNIQNTDCRFDLVAVRLYPDRADVNHIENAFWM